MTKQSDEEKKQIMQARISVASELRTLLYGTRGCLAGGPFHILTDDFNARDSDLLLCYRSIHEPHWAHVRSICLALFDNLAYMNEAQRYLWSRYESEARILEAHDEELFIGDDGDYDVRKAGSGGDPQRTLGG